MAVGREGVLHAYVSKTNKGWATKQATKMKVSTSLWVDTLLTQVRKAGFDVDVSMPAGGSGGPRKGAARRANKK
jgi:hypothetical protein